MAEEFDQITIVKFGDKKKEKKKDKMVVPAVEVAEPEKKIIDHEKHYIFLLRRITETLNKNNPDLAEKSKILLKPPQVIKVSSKKTAIKNLAELCKQLDRHPDHVMNFFMTELGRQGSMGNGGFTIKTSLQQKQAENLLVKYVLEYVRCTVCMRQNTDLVKDEKMRLWTLHCRNCKSTRTVTTIKGAEKKYEDWEQAQEQAEKMAS